MNKINIAKFLALTYKQIFVGTFFIGMFFCARGINRIAQNGDWLHPIAFIGYFFGIAAIILFLLKMFNSKIPFISSDRNAVILLLAIIALKFIAGIVYQFLKTA